VRAAARPKLRRVLFITFTFHSPVLMTCSKGPADELAFERNWRESDLHRRVTHALDKDDRADTPCCQVVLFVLLHLVARNTS
jgi:hypothetical protein